MPALRNSEVSRDVDLDLVLVLVLVVVPVVDLILHFVESHPSA